MLTEGMLHEICLGTENFHENSLRLGEENMVEISVSTIQVCSVSEKELRSVSVKML